MKKRTKASVARQKPAVAQQAAPAPASAPAPSPDFARAVALHQQGKLAEAEALYRAYSAPECVGFAKDAGLSFMHWWDNILYYPEGQIDLSSDLYRRVAALPDESAWSFMELYNGTLGQHGFCVCRPDRPVSSYRIDFTGNAFLNYVPIARGQTVAPSAPLAPDWIAVQRTGFPVYSLNPATAGLYKQANGIRTIRECFAQSGLTAQSDAEMATICRAVFKYLWRTSHVHLKLPA